MTRVLVVITARPSFARVQTVLEACHAHPGIDLRVVPAAGALLRRTGQVAEELLGYHVPATVECHLEGDTHISAVKTASMLAYELAPVLKQQSPDVVVTIADRFETLGTAMAASYQNIPLAHIQGGERSGNIDDKVRDAVTSLADIHFTATQQAMIRVQVMGHADNVHWTGCPSVDLALRCNDGRPLHYLGGGVGPELDLSKPYVMLMLHPETKRSISYNVEMTLRVLQSLEGRQVCGFWPAPDPNNEGIQKLLRKASNVHLWRRLPPEVVYRLLLGCDFVIGNSSVGIRECEALGVWAVNVGNRQRLRERGVNVIDTRMRGVEEAVAKADKLRGLTAGRPPSRRIYGTGDAGTQIASLLANV